MLLLPARAWMWVAARLGQVTGGGLGGRRVSRVKNPADRRCVAAGKSYGRLTAVEASVVLLLPGVWRAVRNDEGSREAEVYMP